LKEKKDGGLQSLQKNYWKLHVLFTSAKLDLDVNEKNRITIKTKNGKYTIGGEPAEDFPGARKKKVICII
jgi:hypothetical protein